MSTHPDRESPVLLSVETGITLLRIEPDKNMRRFYTLSYERDLFGQSVLVRYWGRIGAVGRVRMERVVDCIEATKVALEVVRKKIRRGYKLQP